MEYPPEKNLTGKYVHHSKGHETTMIGLEGSMFPLLIGAGRGSLKHFA